jgi:competence protein ComEA
VPRPRRARLTSTPPTGIGPVLAERIVAWRQEHGRFASVQELARVPGIGARTVERLAPHARAGP